MFSLRACNPKTSADTFNRDYKGIITSAQKTKGTVKFVEDFYTTFVDKYF